LGGKRQVSDTSDNQQRGTIGARKKPKKDCRLRCESDEERDTVVDECNEDTAPDEAGTRECSEDGAISRQGKDSASRYQSLSCNVIRTRDCTLVAKVRNRERYYRRGRNEERHRDEWRIESDVAVRATRKDIIAERGTKGNVLKERRGVYVQRGKVLR